MVSGIEYVVYVVGMVVITAIVLAAAVVHFFGKK